MFSGNCKLLWNALKIICLLENIQSKRNSFAEKLFTYKLKYSFFNMIRAIRIVKM